MDEITEITPNLFVCGLEAINGAILRELGITLIINVTHYVARLEDWSVQEDPIIHLIRIPVDDMETEVLYAYFKVGRFYSFMDRSRLHYESYVTT